MTDCNQNEMKFSNCKRRKVEGSFTGGTVSGDGGVLLLQRADSKIGLTSSVAKELKDERRRKSCKHSLQSLLRQRLYGICMGYEDLNDHNTLRGDIALQTAVQEDEELAGASTLCRWENRADRESVLSIHRVLLDQFISSYKRAPRKIVLDFDATDDAVHGQQEGRFFHGYYDHYCFLPLYVFCGERLLVAYLRQSKIDGAKHAWAILALLVKRLRKAWPKVKIIFRGDSGFCRHQMLRWCERNNVGYIVGAAKNKRLKALSESQISDAGERFAMTGLKQRLFGEIQYAANTWGQQRRVIVKAEHTGKGSNPRYVVTNLTGDPKKLYDKLYCARGDMENRIKEQQMGLFSDRTSCHSWWANQFRLLLSSLAYTLMEAIRRLALKGTELSKAQSCTIRLKLLKIGAVIVSNTRRVKFMFSSTYAYQKLFIKAVARLESG